MEELLIEIGKLSEKILKGVNDSDLIIIVKDGRTNIIEHGKPVKCVKRIEFTHAVDEAPEIIIQKGVI